MPYQLFNNSSKLKLFKLIKRREDNYYICGRKETEIYISTSEIGYQIIRLIEQGYKVSEIKKSIYKKYGSYNVDRFINYLIEQGYVDKINNKKLKEKIKKIRPILKFVDPKYIKWLFSKPMYLTYLIIFFSSFFILIFNPSYFPVRTDYFISQRFIILLPIIFIVSWVLVLLHELMHFFAAKSHNLPAEIGVSNRLFYLVVSTDITSMYALKRENRFRIILAGVFTDIIVLSIAVILLFLNNQNLIHFSILFYNTLKFVVLAEFLGVLWQFLFFLRTDIYYTIENLVKVYNLHEKTDLFVKNEFYKLFFKHHHSSHFENKNEKNIVHVYSILFLVGIFILFYNFFYYYIPITLELISSSLKNIYTGIIQNNYLLFYDSMIFVIFFLIHYTFLVYGIIRHNRLYLRPKLYYLALFSLITSTYSIVFGLILTSFFVLNKLYNFYIFIFLLAILFGAFISYLIRRLDSFAKEELYTPE